MTRGGVETFFPDDIDDALLRRLGPGPGASTRSARTCCFLDNPRGDRAEGRIRARRHPALGTARHRQDAHGRGHGRARPGMPFVNVDASMLGIGIGLLKVKLLFRKLRKYALKYGGVVVVLRRGRLARQPRADRRAARPGHARQDAVAVHERALRAAGSATCPTRRAATLLSTPARAPERRGGHPPQPLHHGDGRDGRRWRRDPPGAAHRAVRASRSRAASSTATSGVPSASSRSRHRSTGCSS